MQRSLANTDNAISRLSSSEINFRLEEAKDLAATLNHEELSESRDLYAQLRGFSQSNHEYSFPVGLSSDLQVIVDGLAPFVSDPVTITPARELARLKLFAFIMDTSSGGDGNESNDLTKKLSTLSFVMNDFGLLEATDRNRFLAKISRVIRESPEEAEAIFAQLQDHLKAQLAEAFESYPDLSLRVLERASAVELAMEFSTGMERAGDSVIVELFDGDNTRMRAYEEAQERSEARKAAVALQAEAEAYVNEDPDEGYEDYVDYEDVGDDLQSESHGIQRIVLPGITPETPTTPSVAPVNDAPAEPIDFVDLALFEAEYLMKRYPESNVPSYPVPDIPIHSFAKIDPSDVVESVSETTQIPGEEGLTDLDDEHLDPNDIPFYDRKDVDTGEEFRPEEFRQDLDNILHPQAPEPAPEPAPTPEPSPTPEPERPKFKFGW
jgi:hypothetical protein